MSPVDMSSPHDPSESVFFFASYERHLSRNTVFSFKETWDDKTIKLEQYSKIACFFIKVFDDLHLGGGFKLFLTSTWGNDPFWPIVFRWVETTKSFNVRGNSVQKTWFLWRSGDLLTKHFYEENQWNLRQFGGEHPSKIHATPARKKQNTTTPLQKSQQIQKLRWNKTGSQQKTDSHCWLSSLKFGQSVLLSWC